MTDIVLLTKSTMKGDYCIAGLDTSFGEWVRLVSDADGSPLLAIHRQYQNVPGECKPLDVVSAELLERVPKRNQTGNRRVKADTMHKLGTMSIDDVLQLHASENHAYIFGNDSASLSAEEMHQYNFNYSLMLVNVKALHLHSGKADFTYNGHHYCDMSITDPDYTFSAGLGNAYLVVSMATNPDRRSGRYHKFIAKIFPHR